jgi:hypothetical protein
LRSRRPESRRIDVSVELIKDMLAIKWWGMSIDIDRKTTIWSLIHETA